jgi:hypothetical protein
VDGWQKEETSSSQSEIQGLASHIKADEERMGKLVSLYLDGDVPKEIYLKRKDVAMRSLATLKDKLKDSERGRNNWVEPLREWILDTKQANFLSKSNDLHKIKALVQKIGTNPRLQNKSAVFEFCPPSQFIAKRREVLLGCAARAHRATPLSDREVTELGEGGIRTRVACAHPLSRRLRYDHFGTSPKLIDGLSTLRPL